MYWEAPEQLGIYARRAVRLKARFAGDGAKGMVYENAGKRGRRPKRALKAAVIKSKRALMRKPKQRRPRPVLRFCKIIYYS